MCSVACCLESSIRDGWIRHALSEFSPWLTLYYVAEILFVAEVFPVIFLGLCLIFLVF